jgi:hypothetical protein
MLTAGAAIMRPRSDSPFSRNHCVSAKPGLGTGSHGRVFGFGDSQLDVFSAAVEKGEAHKSSLGGPTENAGGATASSKWIAPATAAGSSSLAEQVWTGGICANPKSPCVGFQPSHIPCPNMNGTGVLISSKPEPGRGC